MYKALCKNPLYRELYASMADATKDSLWIKAVRFQSGGDDARTSQIVNCFTVGPILSHSEDSRATRVYRVILEEDADTENPTIYALKDAWRKASRRPEILNLKVQLP
ncbi:hypothetical protein B0H17DRAFT_1055590 [Mycena rosella]|uniref:Uncharacterized protein n=1 Tax=Mycena rosella TaxID=1033263 RepID=A0AAD7DQG2_MYCRO|nr:hypothetical protein B0H17DRAFT_1055590 [Mycena rosella]